MKNTMQDYYKVLQYLRETHVDRQYPLTYDNLDCIECNCVPSVSKRYTSDHDNTIKFTEVTGEDIIRIVLDTPRDYIDIDTFEILIYTEETLTKEDISIGFSNLRNGAINQELLTYEDLIETESSIPTDGGYYLFKYQVRKANTTMQKKNRKLGNVSAINVNILTDVDELYLSNMVARVDQFNITLEDLDDNIEMGKNYVMNQLLLDDPNDVPKPLQHLFFKSSGAYAWLIIWEVEGKTMDDGTREGRNYATRLLDQVDAFIEKYVEANPQYNPNKLEDEMIGFSTFCDYPLRKCKKERGRFR